MPIGLDIPRVDGHDKLSGRAVYVDDQPIPGVLHGATVRTPIARGRIKRIHLDPSINWSEFTIVDHRDIPGPNVVSLIEKDWPALVRDEFRHKHEPVMLLAHRSIHKLREALRAVRVDVEPLPAVLDPLAMLTPDLIQHGSDNVLKRLEIRKGNVESVLGQIASHAPTGLASSRPSLLAGTILVKGEYRTGAQEHVYLETQAVAAWHEDGRLVIRGSMQCPYYVLDSLAYFFSRPREAFRVIQAPVGGGFGGKEDYPSILAIHAALLAEKARAPVKIVFDRQEDMAATTKRHPSVVRHSTAVHRDGQLLAMDIDVILDGGAYVTLSPVVLSRGCIHAAGPYYCENIHIRGEARLTNSMPYGAFRGFGAPQTLFATECHMDEIARRLDMDPAELRRRNLLRPGQTMATGQVYRDGPDLPAMLDRALAHASYEERKQSHVAFNASHPYLRRGIGMSTFHHGSGFTGAGETYLKSEVWIEALPDGRVELLTAQTDMGQGTTTILSQIVADRLGIPESQVTIAVPDTSRVPNSGPTVASRTAMVVGKLVQSACDDLRKQLLSAIGDGDDQSRDREGAVGAASGEPLPHDRGSVNSEMIRRWHSEHSGQRLIGRSRYVKPDWVHWDDKNYEGDAYAAYSYGAYVAEVEVDLRTCAMRVTDFVAMQEVGHVVNPTLARGQVQGGVAQGIGWALYENVVLEDGAMKNAQMTNYIIPTSADLPPIRVYFEECPAPSGPAGAKGIGEMPIDGPAPAVVNAVCAALGRSLNEIPLTPERVLKNIAK